MISLLRPAVITLALAMLVLGGAYPALIAAVAAVAGVEPDTTLIAADETEDPRYFFGRPAMASHLSPRNTDLSDRVRARLRAVGATDAHPAPAELVLASASGVDPHISPEAALWQVPRVAAARGVPEGALRALVEAHTEGSQFGFLGPKRVNVPRLNSALETLK